MCHLGPMNRQIVFVRIQSRRYPSPELLELFVLICKPKQVTELDYVVTFFKDWHKGEVDGVVGYVE